MTPRHEDTKTHQERRESLDELTEKHDRTAKQVVDAAFKVHTALGPGLLESVYERCLKHELFVRGLRYRSQVDVPIVYEGITMEGSLRLDLIVEDIVIVELKSAEVMHAVFPSQLLTYLKLTNMRLGLLINFNVPRIKDGIRRVIR